MTRAALLALFLAALVPAAVCADGDRESSRASEVARRLSGHVAVEGDFVQTRHIDGAEAALQSRGHFLFWRDHGVRWAIEEPVQKVVVYRNDTTLVAEGDDVELRPSNSRTEAQFRRLLMTLFSFDPAQLGLMFEQQWEFTDDGGWKVRLLPTDRTTRRHLQSVQMWGNAMIEGVRIAGRDVLTLSFVDPRVLPEPGPEVCTAAFGYSAGFCNKQLNGTGR